MKSLICAKEKVIQVGHGLEGFTLAFRLRRIKG